jgi:6-phosphogluconolactonase (cycloisomerase 2 family)
LADGTVRRVAGLAGIVGLLVCCPAAVASSVYVLNQTDATVSQYSVGTGGTLSPDTPATVATGTGPDGITVSADGKSAYVANGSANSVSQYTVGADGTLSPKTPATVTTGSDPAVIGLSADGKTAYVVNFRGNSVSQYAVAADGTLSPKTPATVTTATAPFGIAVSADGTSVYVANRNSGSVSQYTAATDGTLSPKNPATVAAGSQPSKIILSPDGKSAYVANGAAAGTVSQYNVASDGTLSAKSPATVTAGNQPQGIALSADGRGAYVVNGHGNNLSQYTVATDGTLAPATPATVATGASPGPLVVSADGTAAYVPNFNDNTVSVYAVTADALTPTTPPTVATGAGPTAIAVSPAAPLASAPSAVTGAASAVSGSSASLAGTVNPGGASTAYVFEYGPSLSFGSITTPATAGSGTGAVVVGGSLAGLSAGSTYYYRLVASNAQGTSFGSVASFTTPGPALAPTVVTFGPVSTGDTSGTLAGSVNPNGQATAYTFEYGTTTSFGSITPVVELDNANGPESVSSTVTGLASDTTYLYRVVADNASGTTTGAVMSFTTGPGGAPIVATGAASQVSSTGATLAGTVDPQAIATTFTFEYGTTTSFGSLSSVDNAGQTAGPQAVSLPIGGLAANTTYLYRIVATNADGATAGDVASFTTTGP